MFSITDAFNQNIGRLGYIKCDKLCHGMFRYAAKLYSIIEYWNTSNVTYMQRLFEDALAFNQNIGRLGCF